MVLAGNIRLTNQNEGYIEIKDGSIWRKVVEENWNKKRQKWLCQHLGFEEIDSNVIQTGQLGSGRQIATGDLICYDTTQSSGISCCVNLKPSISTSSTRIPYMRCKYENSLSNCAFDLFVECLPKIIHYAKQLSIIAKLFVSNKHTI